MKTQTYEHRTTSIVIKNMPRSEILEIITAIEQIENKSVKMLKNVLRDAIIQEEKSSKDVEDEHSKEYNTDIEALHYRVKFAESLVNTLLQTIEDIHKNIEDIR